jgi:hypothetical protein
MTIISILNIALLFVFNTSDIDSKYSSDLTEQQKIEYLISHVENLTDAYFIRNGRSHSPKDAASHLRTKLRHSRSHISTAEDFIQICATKSSITGRKYLILFSDGKRVETGKYLYQILENLESSEEDISE